ncbi:hypothetical protein DUNSADRAFT_12496 [Dunaliella salina]|uniref:Uncharacterized protein n=1 Tax=Dunaliella salina TaxID=3046 RepID=A0ABQ7GB81_DUNSA|nr:hypothetical protein DUNSADRAFT_12496 [Dunaliella salina]|eukprot:KAF5831872.1 hypothetical protein DUNSADRAFT_12496 [Dunaliella salina]
MGGASCEDIAQEAQSADSTFMLATTRGQDRFLSVLLHGWLCVVSMDEDKVPLRRANALLACPSIQEVLLHSNLIELQRKCFQLAHHTCSLQQFTTVGRLKAAPCAPSLGSIPAADPSHASSSPGAPTSTGDAQESTAEPKIESAGGALELTTEHQNGSTEGAQGSTAEPHKKTEQKTTKAQGSGDRDCRHHASSSPSLLLLAVVAGLLDVCELGGLGEHEPVFLKDCLPLCQHALSLVDGEMLTNGWQQQQQQQQEQIHGQLSKQHKQQQQQQQTLGQQPEQQHQQQLQHSEALCSWLELLCSSWLVQGDEKGMHADSSPRAMQCGFHAAESVPGAGLRELRQAFSHLASCFGHEHGGQFHSTPGGPEPAHNSAQHAIRQQGITTSGISQQAITAAHLTSTGGQRRQQQQQQQQESFFGDGECQKVHASSCPCGEGVCSKPTQCAMNAIVGVLRGLQAAAGSQTLGLGQKQEQQHNQQQQQHQQHQQQHQQQQALLFSLHQDAAVSVLQSAAADCCVYVGELMQARQLMSHALVMLHKA